MGLDLGLDFGVGLVLDLGLVLALGLDLNLDLDWVGLCCAVLHYAALVLGWARLGLLYGPFPSSLVRPLSLGLACGWVWS